MIHRIRAAAIGSEADMARLLRAMLRHAGALEEPDDRPTWTMRELYDQTLACAAWELGEGRSFVYDFLSPSPFGEMTGEGEFELSELGEGLWSACFSFNNVSGFQPEDWMRLHRDSGRVPIFLIHASEDFSFPKGGAVFMGGTLHEDWNRMAETWFWLIRNYECGRDPSELLSEFNAIQSMLDSEDWDQNIGGIIRSCLECLHQSRAGLQISLNDINDAVVRRDFSHLIHLQTLAADAVLFDARRSARYLACLNEDLDVWLAAHPEDLETLSPENADNDKQ